jgi:pimeloyl-ACP methyl ester carboxylesterase
MVLRIAHDASRQRVLHDRVHVQAVVIHGYRRVFRIAGSGPALLLLHGIGDSSRTWAEIIPTLARNHLVIAPDLLGHGDSDKPRADYSVAAYANGMRDLLSALDIETVTLVGHSLGGGVAMQFAYQYPERTERLVLVSSGGAGRCVSPLLRAAALPGAGLAVGGLRLPGARLVVNAAIEILERLDTGLGVDAEDLARVVDALPDATARSAFIRTLRSVVDWRGQIVTMADRAYLTEAMPLCVIWGEEDRVIPASHAATAAELAPGARIELIANAGHFPHKDHPERFARIVHDFVRKTQPATYSRARFRNLLREGQVPAGVTEQPVEIATVTPIRGA